MFKCLLIVVGVVGVLDLVTSCCSSEKVTTDVSFQMNGTVPAGPNGETQYMKVTGAGRLAVDFENEQMSFNASRPMILEQMGMKFTLAQTVEIVMTGGYVYEHSASPMTPAPTCTKTLVEGGLDKGYRCLSEHPDLLSTKINDDLTFYEMATTRMLTYLTINTETCVPERLKQVQLGAQGNNFEMRVKFSNYGFETDESDFAIPDCENMKTKDEPVKIPTSQEALEGALASAMKR